MVELLLSLILAVTGISRTVDPVLTAEAERRASMIISDYSHNGQVYPEILHWHNTAQDPMGYTVGLWRESPAHWAVMTDRSLTRIGCAVLTQDWAGTVYYIACVFAPPVVQSTPVENPPMLPNTAMEDE